MTELREESGGRDGRGAEPAPPPLEKLSPGPGLPAAQVAASQRARLHAALLEAVAAGGYPAVTVRQLVRAAGVSARAFYEHFGGKQECLAETCERVMQRAAERLLAAQQGERDPAARLRCAFAELAAQVERHPDAARLALVEAPPVLAPARLRRAEEALQAAVAESLAAAGGAEPPPLLAKGVLAGVAQVVRARLLGGREAELAELSGELAEWALCCCGGATEEALRALARDPAPPPGDGAEEADDEQAPPGEERAMILAAALRLAAAEGYAALTVPRVRAAAGVSRRSFDSHFAGAEDCFLSACELSGGRALARAARAGAGAGSWQGAVHRVLAALCAQAAHRPEFARCVLGEIAAAGREGMLSRERLVAVAARGFRAAAPPQRHPAELASEASTGAIWGVLEHHVALGREAELPGAAPTLSLLALAPCIGSADALEAVRGEELRMRGEGGGEPEPPVRHPGAAQREIADQPVPIS